MCPWNPNIPQSYDLRSDSQGDLLSDFQAISAMFEINHGDLATNNGKHEFVQFPLPRVANTPNPLPDTLANEAGLYSIPSVNNPQVNNLIQLAFRRENNGVQIPFTDGTNLQSGWYRFPSGLLLKWGYGESGPRSNNLRTLTWRTDTQPVFATQFWTAIFPATGVDSTEDPDYVAYVTDISNPAQVSFRTWQRSSFSAQFVGAAFIFIIALGVE